MAKFRELKDKARASYRIMFGCLPLIPTNLENIEPDFGKHMGEKLSKLLVSDELVDALHKNTVSVTKHELETIYGNLYRVENGNGLRIVTNSRKIYRLSDKGRQDTESWGNLCGSWREWRHGTPETSQPEEEPTT